MIIGAHSIIYSSDADADRAFLRDVLRFPHVDVGEGWLIFGLPPSEVAIHPGTEDDGHEFYLAAGTVDFLMYETLMEDGDIGKKMIQSPERLLRTGGTLVH